MTPFFLTSFSIMYIVTFVNSLSFFVAEECYIVWIYHNLFIYLLVGIWVVSRFFSFVFAVHIQAQVFVWT